ncbi:amidase [Actinopolymorpha sp. B11F2]|uniref:amidase n=1 Tax=Actinopolymorpha sp. B11F2 TaxID=3160862 RepID=UPI0032E37D86
MRGTTVDARTLLAEWAAVRRGDLDLVSLADEICTRIESVDADLQAFVAEPDRRQRVRTEASEMVRRWPDPRERPPLFGVPLGVKDVVHVDGLPTGAGARLPIEVLAASDAVDAPAVARLRDAGALVMGKTVTAEFAFMAPGPTRNPHDLRHTPGGSSSGSAAAVAAGLVALAIGTQTVGSVIRPAAFCGVVGFKPTYGRIPTAGVIANAPSFDTVGLLSHDVATATTAAAVVCDGWRARMEAGPMRRPVLGVPEGPYLDQATAEARQAFADQVGHLEDAGFAVRRISTLTDLGDVIQRNDLINLVELAWTHETWFRTYEDRYREQSATAIREGRRISVQAYERALTERKEYAAALVAQMDAEGIDGWIAPAATGPAPEGLHTTGSPLMNLPWTQARLPVVGVPAGAAANGLPLGVQFAARPNADEDLLNWAVELEGALATSA